MICQDNTVLGLAFQERYFEILHCIYIYLYITVPSTNQQKLGGLKPVLHIYEETELEDDEKKD